VRRLSILLAVLGALLLVPAANAFAATNTKVNITGPGSGEVISIGSGFFGEEEANPPLACKYNGTSTSGVCQTEAKETEEESGYYYIELEAKPAPGWVFGTFTIQKGEGYKKGQSQQCPYRFNPGEPPQPFCYIASENEGEEIEVTATFTKEIPAGPTLTLTKEGGEGTVVSNPGGITCGGKCSASFETGKVVTLTASPASGYMFSSWKGCDKGGAIGRQCTITMSAAKSAVAKFVPSYKVSVTKSGSGIGKVQSAPGGVLCLVNCTATAAEFKGGASVTLTAAPSKHFHLVHWTGDCSGSSLTCSLPSLAANKSVGAEFAEDAQFALTLNKEGGGNGTVKADIAGINCGATCTTQVAKYYEGTEVTLTATPGKGSALKEWTGACSGSGTCKVTLNAAKTVGAKFE
jgi:Divergent InlB B-repeat domain